MKRSRMFVLALITLVVASLSLLLIAAAPRQGAPPESAPLMFVLLLFFGFMATEGTVEYLLGTPFDKFPKLTPHKWLLMYVSLAVGEFLAFHYQLDIVSLLGKPVDPVGITLTGVVMGRGANFVSDLWGKFFIKKP